MAYSNDDIAKMLGTLLDKLGSQSRSYSSITKNRHGESYNASEADKELEIFKRSLAELNNSNFASSIKKYFTDIKQSLTMGKGARDEINRFGDTIKELANSIKNSEGKDLLKRLGDLAKNSKISVDTLHGLSNSLEKYEEAVVKNKRSIEELAKKNEELKNKQRDFAENGAGAAAIVELEKNVELLTKTIIEQKKEIAQQAKQIKDSVGDNKELLKPVENALNGINTNATAQIDTGTSSSVSKFSRSFVLYKTRMRNMLKEQMEEMPGMIISAVLKGLSAGAKRANSDMMAGVKYYIPDTSYATLAMSGLNANQQELDQAIYNNRFGYRMLGSNNSSLTGIKNVTDNTNLRNSLVSFGATNGAENLAALQTGQEMMAAMGLNIGNANALATQLDALRNIARGTGYTDKGVESFNSALSQGGALFAMVASENFKNQKEQQKYLNHELKTRLALTRVMGLSIQQQEQIMNEKSGLGNAGLETFIRKTAVQPRMMQTAFRQLGMKVSSKEMFDLANFSSFNPQQRAKLEPQLLALDMQLRSKMAQAGQSQASILNEGKLFAMFNTLSEASGGPTANNMFPMVGNILTSISTMRALMSKNPEIAKQYGFNSNMSQNAFENQYENILRGKHQAEFVRALQKMATATSTGKAENTKTMGMKINNAVLHMENAVLSFVNNPFGDMGAAVAGTIGDVLKMYLLSRFLKAGTLAEAVTGMGTDLVAVVGGGLTAVIGPMLAVLATAYAAWKLGGVLYKAMPTKVKHAIGDTIGGFLGSFGIGPDSYSARAKEAWYEAKDNFMPTIFAHKYSNVRQLTARKNAELASITKQESEYSTNHGAVQTADGTLYLSKAKFTELMNYEKGRTNEVYKEMVENLKGIKKNTEKTADHTKEANDEKKKEQQMKNYQEALQSHISSFANKELFKYGQQL